MQMRNLEEKSKKYKALSEPVRLRIIEYLLKKGQCTCICELSQLLKKDQSVIFRHIQILKEAGILNANKKEKYLMCCIKDKNKVKKYIED